MVRRRVKGSEYLLSLSEYHCIENLLSFFHKNIHEKCFWEGEVCVDGKEGAVLGKSYRQQSEEKSDPAQLGLQRQKSGVWLPRRRRVESAVCGYTLGLLSCCCEQPDPLQALGQISQSTSKNKACFR